MLRISIARTMDRLDAMDAALQRGRDEVAMLESQILFLRGNIGRLKDPGIVVSMDEYHKIRVNILHLEDKRSRVSFEMTQVERAMEQAERHMDHETQELRGLERFVGVLLQFRRNE